MNNNMNAQQIVQEQIRRGSMENPSTQKSPVKKIRIEEVMLSRGSKEINDQQYNSAF